MKHSFDDLIAHIQQLEAEREELGRQNRLLSHRLEAERKQVAGLDYRAKTMHSLGQALVSLLDPAQIYAMTCESLVYQLGWDSAFVLTESKGAVKVEASYQATQKQLQNIKSEVTKSASFLEAYALGIPYSTLQSNQKDALLLRTVFHTDEVVVMPLVFASHTLGVIVVCSHSQPRQPSVQHDLAFLSEVAGLVATSVHTSTILADLEKENSELKKNDALKDTFISITSHQLRTPLSVVKWALSILQTDPKIMSLEQQFELINQASEGNDNLIKVVNDLLNVSRISNGELPYDLQPVDLTAEVKRIVTNAKRIAALRKLKLKSEVEADIPFVEADPLLIREAIQNLVNNALDYSPTGATITVKMGHVGRKLELSVSNEGPGIPPSEQGRIFERFYRSPEARRQQPDGSGLGLYLSQTIVQEHKGKLTLESDSGLTTFSIILPTIK